MLLRQLSRAAIDVALNGGSDICPIHGYFYYQCESCDLNVWEDDDGLGNGESHTISWMSIPPFQDLPTQEAAASATGKAVHDAIFHTFKMGNVAMFLRLVKKNMILIINVWNKQNYL